MGTDTRLQTATGLQPTRHEFKVNRLVRDTIAGYLFLLPALTLFVVFIALPLVAVITLCFTQYNIITPPRFIGFKNFLYFADDPRLPTIIINTITFVVILVPMHVVVGLLLALGATRRISSRWKTFYRTIFYVSSLVPTAAVAVAWSYIYDVNFGVANFFLSKLHIQPIPWLVSPVWVYVAVALFSLWKFVGIDFLYYVIGIQGIDKTLYEAAEIDGANSVQSFFRITLPMLTPTIFFVVVTTLIGAIQIFDEPFLITGGGPGDASRSVTMYIYELAFQDHSYGYASTVSVMLFVAILLLTIVQFRFNRWVHYGQE